MKRTEISYAVTADDRILVVGIRNIMDMVDVEEKFGSEVARLYSAGQSYRRVNGEIEKTRTINVVGYGYVNVDCKYSKEDFQAIISLMKQSGKCFGNIVKAVNDYKQKTIII